MMDCMLDLETMGTGPDAAIIAIGAVAFDPERNAMPGGVDAQFYATIDLSDAMRCGGVVDGDTVMWWMARDDSARAQFAAEAQTTLSALTNLAAWMHRNDIKHVWGNGAEFDNVILSAAYRRLDAPLPWKFYNNRCYRTLKAMSPQIKLQRVGTYHNALDDAKSQAQHLLEILANMPLKRAVAP